MPHSFKGFLGFLDEQQPVVGVPSIFFTELLPSIDHLIELKVTLYCLWSITMQEGDYRYIRFSEVCQDNVFMKAMPTSSPQSGELIVRDGFERAVARGTLLHIHVKLSASEDDIYFLNTETGKAAIRAIQENRWIPDDNIRPIALLLERPPIYRIYEQNIGLLTPMVADELDDLLKEYPYEWLTDAIRIASLKNITNIRYIGGILDRWRKQGRGDTRPAPEQESEEDYSDYLKSQYPDLFEDKR